MAKIGTVSLAVDVPEFPMTSYDAGTNIVSAAGLPTDGSLILARLINGTISFTDGVGRLVQFTGETAVAGTDIVDLAVTAGFGYPPIGWHWVSRA